MRISFLSLLIAITATIPPNLSGQHYNVQDFKQHQQRIKSAGDTLFLVETGYPATGILLKVDDKENIPGSFLVAGKDTLNFTEGDEGPAGEYKKFSNLLTFSNPIYSFLFYPGVIKGEIQFYYINAQQNKEGSTVRPSKKKRFRLCRARHD
jgi:hypothetical protein